MAILQISRITHRKGLQENLPQLSGAEIGWTVDKQRLFIGNGTLADGAPTVGNTEILTEHSDIFAAINNYTYKGSEGGYVVTTGVSAGNDITRTLQHKLDDFASVRDFGAVGDGTTDDTAAINRALYELFCRETTTTVRRSLFFPAGTYLTSSTILIPPYAKLYGEGAESSIISYAVREWAYQKFNGTGSQVTFVLAETANIDSVLVLVNNIVQPPHRTSGDSGAYTISGNQLNFISGYEPVAGTNNVIVQLIDPTYKSGDGVIKTTGADTSNYGRYIAVKDVPAGIDIANTTYWQRVDVNGRGVVVRTADNQQKTGAQNGINNRISSRYIEIDSMSFVSTETVRPSYPVDIMLLESASNISIDNVVLAGPITATSQLANSLTQVNLYDTSCVVISTPLRGDSTTQICKQIKFTNCVLSGQTYGVTSNSESRAITFAGCDFDLLYNGVNLIQPVGVNGPTGYRFVENMFDNIYSSGIVFAGVSTHVSAHNVFYTVGQTNGGVVSQYVPCILINGKNNLSLGDMFQRNDSDASIVPRINLLDSYGVPSASIAMDLANKIELGSYNRETGQNFVLVNNTSNFATIFSRNAYPEVFGTDQSTFRAFTIDYTITRYNAVRKGTITVVGASSDSDSSDMHWSDDYIENSPTGVTLALTQSGSAISLQYKTTATSNNGIIRYSITYLTSTNLAGS